MALQRVPVTTDIRQTFDTALDGQLVRFTVWWQPFDSQWYMSLEYQTGERIISGRRLIVGQDVLAGVVSSFHGSLVVDGISDTIGVESWNVTHDLIYDSEG